MGKKRKDETGSVGSETSKKPRKGTENSNQVTEKPKKNSVSAKENSEVVKSTAKKEPLKNYNSSKIYTDSSSSSDSESEKNSNKNDKKSVSESNSDSESDSSGSDSSPTSREDGEPEKPPARTQEVVSQKNSITNLMPVKSYVPPPKSSSSDSYHSDTEEEDKKRRKKQKKLLQMQLNKKVKRGNLPKTAEMKYEVHSDEDGPDNPASNNDELPEWPESDYAELIKRMEAQIPAKDNLKFDSRAAKLDWSSIAFGNYSPEDCLEVWLAILKRIRRYRTLPEILQDAREWVTKPWTHFYRGSKKNRHPDMPSRPLSTYMLYYLEKKDKVAKENPGLDMTQVSRIISEMYRNLSPADRDKYTELAAKQRQNFEAKFSEFCKEHPELAQEITSKKNATKEVTAKGPRKASNPFKLFFQEHVKMHGKTGVDKKTLEEEAKEKWKNLNDKKKLIWINWALEDHKRYEDEMKAYRLEHPDYIPPNAAKSVLNKDERLIKERLAGKPVKPPNSAYSLFSRLMLQSDPDVKSIPPKQRMAEISRKWKEIPDTQKLHYEEKVRTMQEVYKSEFASYLESLPPKDREEELKKNQPKRKTTKAEEKAKKKALKNSVGGNKRNSKKKEEEVVKRYKGEPKPPPVKAFELYLESFPHDRNRSESQREKEALKTWNALPEAKKEVYIKKLEELKQKYIKDFEVFLKSLSPDEIKEFSILRELAKKSKLKEEREAINGTAGDSNEESGADDDDEDDDDEDDDEGSSSDSGSDDSDSGKSSKSNSTSEDSDS